MTETARITKEFKAEFTVRELAEMFSGLNDDSQAQFFEEVGQIMNAWERPAGNVFFHGAWGQQWEIGRHLATCKCITDAGREVIKTIHSGMTYKAAPVEVSA